MTEILIETAQMIAELTWTQPEPEKRGSSLRKGASGMGYLLHCLSRAYKKLSNKTQEEGLVKECEHFEKLSE